MSSRRPTEQNADTPQSVFQILDGPWYIEPMNGKTPITGATLHGWVENFASRTTGSTTRQPLLTTEVIATLQEDPPIQWLTPTVRWKISLYTNEFQGTYFTYRRAALSTDGDVLEEPEKGGSSPDMPTLGTKSDHFHAEGWYVIEQRNQRGDIDAVGYLSIKKNNETQYTESLYHRPPLKRVQPGVMWIVRYHSPLSEAIDVRTYLQMTVNITLDP